MSWQAPLEIARRALLDRLLPKTGERVLDVACGTGLLALELARIVASEGEVVGIDLSQAMVDVAAHRDRGPGSGPIDDMRMDARALALPSSSFDAVFCCFGLMDVPEPERAIAEMRRVLKPGGHLGLAVWGERARCASASVFPIVDAEVASEVCPLFFRLGGGDALARACRRAGFSVTWRTRLATSLAHSDDDEACDAVFIAGPAALAWARFGEGVRARVRQRDLDAIVPWRAGESYEVPAEFVGLHAQVEPT